jgi:Flp pilus assembly protein protease CpaA
MDLWKRRIPNALVVLGLGLGLWMAAQTGRETDALYGVALAFAIGIVPFALNALGAGDVKATMVVGSFVGPHAVTQIILWTAVGCGAIAGLWWLAQHIRPSANKPTIPVGLPLALSTWALTLLS